jgi:hypothetical protein
MEVHHPHHPAHKKKWGEYFLEFFMLFIAVTLGFFAENKREEMVEGHREHQYIQSLYEDLKKDTGNLNNLIKYDIIQISKIDTATNILTDVVLNDSTIKLLYRVNLKTLGNIRLTLNERTSSQLKNSGGMRLIENQEISNQISEYWELADVIKNIALVTEELKLRAREKSYSIFYQKYYLDFTTGEVSKGVKLMNNDPMTLTEYSNRLNHIRNSMKVVQVPLIEKLHKKASQLITLLKKEYELNDKAEVVPVFN